MVWPLWSGGTFTETHIGDGTSMPRREARNMVGRDDDRWTRVDAYLVSSSTIQPAPCTSRAMVSAKRMSVAMARPVVSL